MKPEQNLIVAEEILKQLGGSGRLTAMIGANTFWETVKVCSSSSCW